MGIIRKASLLTAFLFFATASSAATKINPFTGKPDLTGGSGGGITESSSPTWTGTHLFRSSVTIDQIGTSGAQLTLDNNTAAQDTGILFKSSGTNVWAIKNLQTQNYLRIDSGGFSGGTTIAAFTTNGTLLGASSLPGSTLGVFGNAAIGTLYSLSAGPSNGLAVEGSLGVGTINPTTKVVISSGVLTLDGVGSGINTATNTWVNFAGTATISDLFISTNNATTSQQSLRITNAGTGDSGISFTGGAVNYGLGIDNSEASDALTLSNGTTLGTNNIWKITTAGVQTGPNNIGIGSYVPTTVVAVGAQSAGSLTSGTRIGVDAYGTKNDSGNSANNVIGFEAIGENSGSGNAAGIRGLICQAYNHPSGGSPTFTYARGADLSIYTQGAGAITTAHVLHAILDGTAAGNVTTGAGVFIDSPTALGTLTTYRALEIAGTGGSNSWSVYSSTGKNYFGANVGIRITSATTAPLMVLGEDNWTVMVSSINATQANVTGADTFISFESNTGQEGSVAGTAVAGVLAYNTFTGSHWTKVRGEPHILAPLCSTGEPYEESGKAQLVKSEVCTEQNSKRVLGFYGGKDKKGNALALALGTGFAFVRNTGVNIEIGDWLNTTGDGISVKVQMDDVQYNHSIAKALVPVKWKAGEKTRKIPVTYHAG